MKHFVQSNIRKCVSLLPFHVLKLPASSLHKDLNEKHVTHLNFFHSKDHLNIDRFKNILTISISLILSNFISVWPDLMLT
jgi:hypothetical protein